MIDPRRSPSDEDDGENGEPAHALSPAGAEGLLILESALRLSVKNRIIREVMGPSGANTLSDIERLIVHELRVLGDEARGDAQRLRAAEADAAQKGGRARHGRDYRAVDVPGLRARIAASESLGERVSSLACDSDYVRAQADRSRADALEDMTTTRLPAVRHGSVDSIARDEALGLLRHTLRRERRRHLLTRASARFRRRRSA